MKIFSISFIFGVFLTMFVVRPVLNSFDIPNIGDVLITHFAESNVLAILFGVLIIFVILIFVYKFVRKSKFINL